MSYDLLRERGGVQWPCTPEAPHGTERLYTDGAFFSAPDYCESYGKDLVTGTPVEPTDYRALNPDAKAVIKAARYVRPHEVPDTTHPLVLTTGRTLFHFHTRTKTARAPQLQDAAPQPWVEISATDATRYDIGEGDLVEVFTPRSIIQVRARISGIRPGVVFVPFHYGYWDTDDTDGGRHDRAANELTRTDWDPASKQPLFKTAAAGLRKISAGTAPSAAPTNTASAPVDPATVPATVGGDAAASTEKVVQ